MAVRDRFVALAATPRVCPRCGSRAVRYPVSTHRREVREAVKVKIAETGEITGVEVDAAEVLAASRGIGRLRHGGEVCERCLAGIVLGLNPVVLVRWVWWRDNRGRLPFVVREGGFIPEDFPDRILEGVPNDLPYRRALRMLRWLLAAVISVTGLVFGLGLLGVLFGFLGGWTAALLLSGLVTGGLLASLRIARGISRLLGDLREWRYFLELEDRKVYPHRATG
ncbi:hypothetical protein E0L93_08780 [Rubrobacter taiwanensis]|jgi:hypothetical protein|uniref:Uncharacterized protein n=1 Tax=Rubrobacter taiwanensis TaxID=185139 RepID=A0A4R1BHP4_9ACTN|nr:hypothetical protein [Rubrobacter taiwanensis]TCJ16806.1 hypothetical protein E0L93_08780 [Rubrobacter taiwanensis]